MFASNDDVAFADINLQEAQIRGSHNPGRGGWPTIKYFNKETGYGGAHYKQKTDKSMCDELGPNESYMQEYVEEAGKASLCSLEGKGCNEKEVDFIAKWKDKSAVEIAAEADRLEGMKGRPMRQKVKQWQNARVRILQKLRTTASGNDEL